MALRRYSWPGNVRELKSVIERALLISDTDEIMVEDLMLSNRPVGVSEPVSQHAPVEEDSVFADEAGAPTDSSLSDHLAAMESPDEIVPLEELKKLAIEHAHRVCGGNINKTADKLGVTRSTVYRLMRKYGLED